MTNLAASLAGSGALAAAATGNTPSTGDPLRDAFRAQLASVMASVGFPPNWSIVDTINTQDQPDAMSNFITLRFAGSANEEQYSFGAPGANLWKERGDVFIDFFPGLGTGHNVAEQLGLAVRNAFRHARFAMSTGQTVRVLTVAPMSGGPVDGAWWCETIAIAYRVFNTG